MVHGLFGKIELPAAEMAQVESQVYNPHLHSQDPQIIQVNCVHA